MLTGLFFKYCLGSRRLSTVVGVFVIVVISGSALLSQSVNSSSSEFASYSSTEVKSSSGVGFQLDNRQVHEHDLFGDSRRYYQLQLFTIGVFNALAACIRSDLTASLLLTPPSALSGDLFVRMSISWQASALLWPGKPLSTWSCWPSSSCCGTELPLGWLFGHSVGASALLSESALPSLLI